MRATIHVTATIDPMRWRVVDPQGPFHQPIEVAVIKQRLLADEGFIAAVANMLAARSIP